MTRTDSRMITLTTDGVQVEYHPSFSFPRHVFRQFKQEDKDTLRRKRAAYNESKRQRSDIQEPRLQISEQNYVSSNSPPDNVSVLQRSRVNSQMTTGQPVMGGWKEQAQNRQNRQIAALTTQRHVPVATPIATKYNEAPLNTSGSNKCDTNAYTCCLGRNFVVLHSTFRT